MTSHLYLDIDGVLNAVGWSGAHTPPWDDLCRPGPALTYSPGLVRGLNQVIANTPELEVFWLTSWEEEAAQFGERLGLAAPPSGGGCQPPVLDVDWNGRNTYRFANMLRQRDLPGSCGVMTSSPLNLT